MSGESRDLRYRVELRRRRGKQLVYFLEGDAVVVAATLVWPRTLEWLDELGFKPLGRNVWGTDSMLAFLEAIVLYGVAQTMRSAGKLSQLRKIVDELELLELRFWANKLSEGYRRRGRLGMYRPARSFKILYRLMR
ncbi:MAG TPA: hypothetical protein EYH26_01375 [Pyrodictium sp.]|nr:hypothetical protein [Pyrodictium sp.]